MSGALLLCAVLLFACAMHSFVTYPLSLLLLAKLRPQDSQGNEDRRTPPNTTGIDFTLCMCAYNEAAVIRQKLQNLLALREREPGLEILIYVDAASDDTARLLRAYAPHIQVHVSRERRGKTYGMNLLAARASGSILVFTDANVMLDMDCLHHLRRAFSDPNVGCVGGHLVYTNGHASVTASTGALYWRLEESIKRLEEHTGSVMGADGSLFAVRKSLHRPPPEHIIDDMYVSFMVLLNGYRIVQSRDARAYEASASSALEEFSRKSRIACQAFNVHRLLWPRLREMDPLTVYKYVSHKLMRWLSIYFLAASALCCLAALTLDGHLRLAAAGVLGGIVLLLIGQQWSVKPLAQIVDVVLSLTGTGLGVWKSMRGERFQTWTPAATVRKAAE
jgi:cellulose synthase/poly-beta-1,6-N-acetylglucosamine synthase-like glycosyltransferase